MAEILTTIISFFDSLLDFFTHLWENLLKFFSDLWLQFKLWANELTASITPPDFVTSAPSTLMSLMNNSDFGFYANLLELPFGISIVVTAYIARFAVRRLPFVG